MKKFLALILALVMALSADERQTTFTNMMKIALEIAVKMDKQ